MPLRPHQEQFNKICQSIKAGSSINEVFVYAKPGAGKSTYGAIASQLIEDDNTKLLWVAPRESLIIQAEKDFRGAGHFNVGDKDIRSAGNSGCPFRSNCGAVISYQAIIANPDKWIEISEKYKLILILDEFDSLTDFSSWSKPIEKIYKNSILRISMSGTLDRSDRLPVSFVPYDDNQNIDFSDTNTRKWIIYDTEQAIKDKSIVSFEAKLLDGSGKYIDANGITRNFKKFTGNGDELQTAFSTEFAYDMFNLSIKDWITYKEINPWAKMLVIAANIKIAKDYTKWFKEYGYRFEIATSEDSSGSRESIRRMKLDNNNSNAYEGLVTVGQAYKGLNIPQCTFLVFLTKIRGKSWCDQAIGRIQRTYKDKEKGFLYAPNDPKLRIVLKDLACDKILSAIGEPIEEGQSSKNESPNSNPDYNGGIQALKSEAHIKGIPIFPQFIPESKQQLTQSEQEKYYRKKINSVIRSIVAKESAGNRKVKERIFWMRIKQIVNKGRNESGKLIRKPLKEMTLKELKKISEFSDNYLT